ncbi:hypothetical protein Sango_2906100 [Sesamum angolense]|uniref:Reverse transcriptase domain-containing protein n=1 Tax=Sesamum angolense TaxID=2727404 RepID=A0AAE1T6G4_9LAMI|nr:hypothetical protein Sango_2906100 [Sesamum angolense]
MIYGANDIRTQRDLWRSVGNLFPFIGDEPWLVMGDFNTVLDMSEHNCSDGNQSLWKRLDHMLLNDRWLERWTNVAYTSLPPRTSDHSPLVLCGNPEDKSPGPDGYSAGCFKAKCLLLVIRSSSLGTTNNVFFHGVLGSIHGFFPGARGFRLGDPMSPYFFVLVMEVLQMLLSQLIEHDSSFGFHWKCSEIGLFQLCFADDLLLFCNADEAYVFSVLVWSSGVC